METVFGVPASDLSLQGLNQIFGLDSADSQFNTISNLMGVWNGSMMLIGSIIVGYIIIAGVLKTAHQGTALGNKWSSFWIPLRAALGLAATAPVLGGYCAVQLLVLYSATAGIGLADVMWGTAARQISQNGGFVLQPPTDVTSLKIIKNMYLATTCEIATNIGIAEDLKQGSAAGPTIYSPNPWVSPRVTPTAIKFTDKSGNFNCGGLIWPNANSLGQDDAIIINTQRTAIMSIHEQMVPLIAAEQNPQSPQPITLAQMKGLVDQYTQSMAAAVQQLQDRTNGESFKNLGEDAAKDGWALAGSYYARIAGLNKNANQASLSEPGGLDMYSPLPNSMTASKMAQAEANIKSLLNEALPGASSQEHSLDGDSSSWLAMFSHPFLNAQDSINKIIASAGDPLTRMQNIGHIAIDAGYTILATQAVANIATTAVPGGSVLKKAAGAVMDTVGGIFSGGNTIAAALIVIGLLLAYVLPLIPFALMLFGVLSWFVSVFIAVVAAPLWAISHATPDGHEAFGSGTNGYIMLMSITLRPALTILAMFGSMAILFAIDKIFSAGYMLAFSGAQINHITGLVGMLVGNAIYCILCLALVYACYHIIQTLPNGILQWAGGRDDDAVGVQDHNNRIIAAVSTGGGMMKSGGRGAGGVAKAAKPAIPSVPSTSDLTPGNQ